MVLALWGQMNHIVWGSDSSKSGVTARRDHPVSALNETLASESLRAALTSRPSSTRMVADGVTDPVKWWRYRRRAKVSRLEPPLSQRQSVGQPGNMEKC